MGASTVSYTKANYGNLGKWFGDKVKSAANMAAEERKYAKEHAEQQRKEGVPEEEIKKKKASKKNPVQHYIHPQVKKQK